MPNDKDKAEEQVVRDNQHPIVGGPSFGLVEKLEGDALKNFLMDLNGFHLELWVVQLSAEMPAAAKKLAQVIRERHQELLRKHGVSH